MHVAHLCATLCIQIELLHTSGRTTLQWFHCLHSISVIPCSKHTRCDNKLPKLNSWAATSLKVYPNSEATQQCSPSQSESN